MSTEPTIFGRILDGEIPCHRIHEDEHVLAFLDVGPLSRGHTLVIPKQRVPSLQDLSDASAAALGRILPRLVRAIAAVTGTEDCNVLINNGAPAGQEVMHVHVHIIPVAEGQGLQKHWQAGELPAGEGADIAREIREMM